MKKDIIEQIALKYRPDEKSQRDKHLKLKCFGYILDCIDKIKIIQEKGDINEDVILYDATLRNLQTLSEATRYLPENKTKQYPTIPWRDISGFRKILAHDYLGEIDAATVFQVVNEHILPLEMVINEMLEKNIP